VALLVGPSEKEDKKASAFCCIWYGRHLGFRVLVGHWGMVGFGLIQIR